jgi:hypothetical protein
MSGWSKALFQKGGPRNSQKQEQAENFRNQELTGEKGRFLSGQLKAPVHGTQEQANMPVER